MLIRDEFIEQGKRLYDLSKAGRETAANSAWEIAVALERAATDSAKLAADTLNECWWCGARCVD